MTIVPIGNLTLQVPGANQPDFIAQLIQQMAKQLRAVVGRMIEESLETEVDRFLGRPRYQRRKRAKRQEHRAYCSRCRTHQRQRFRRNGHYLRWLETSWGAVQIQLPQVKCLCGGNVKMSYQTIRPRQRKWTDVQLEVQVDYGRGLSYRQIKHDLDGRLGSALSLRTLNQWVLAQGAEPAHFATWGAGRCPPVVRVDGIWITVLFPTGETQPDRAGRKRSVKQSRRIPILAAQGVWPASGRTQLIAWMQAEGEDTASWQRFLEQLSEAGLSAENGLALLVADGATGFRAAYENVYWQVPFQRCVFHKLRNLAKALRTPAELDRTAAHEYRTQFLQAAAQIWQAPDEAQAQEVFRDFCQTWQTRQSRAIATLQRDFEATLSFYAVQQQAATRGQDWPASQLRTTSPLERTFREFRRRYRAALLFHSPAGAAATTAQIAKRFS